jgi:hypothetical protein
MAAIVNKQARVNTKKTLITLSDVMEVVNKRVAYAVY